MSAKWETFVSEYRSLLQERLRHSTKPDERIVPWVWVASKLADVLSEFPSGVTKSVIMSELELHWNLRRSLNSTSTSSKFAGLASIWSQSASSKEGIMMEATVKDFKQLPDTKNILLTICDLQMQESTGEILGPSFQMFLHHKFHEFTTESCELRELLSNRGIRFSLDGISEFGNRQRVMPTENMVFLLDETSPADRSFISNTFQDSLPFSEQSYLINRRDIYLLLEVVIVDVAVKVRNELGECDSVCKSVYLRHLSSGKQAILELWNDKKIIGDMIMRGDVIALWRPHISSCQSDEVRFQYGLDTFIFLVLRQKTGGDGENAASADEQDRLTLSTEPPNISNIRLRLDSDIGFHLFGIVSRILPNAPLSYGNGHISDRYGLRLSNGIHTVDVTLWDEVGRSCRHLVEGDIILVQNLRCVPAQSHGHTSVMGSKDLGTSIVCS